MKGDRGEHINKIGWVNYFESEKDRDRYWPEIENSSEEGKAAMEKLQPMFDELEKLGTWSREYSGWVIQQGILKEFQAPGSRWGFFMC